MKLAKITSIAISRCTQDSNRDKITVNTPHEIKLRAVSSSERQNLRISSYQYLLP